MKPLLYTIILLLLTANSFATVHTRIYTTPREKILAPTDPRGYNTGIGIDTPGAFIDFGFRLAISYYADYINCWVESGQGSGYTFSDDDSYRVRAYDCGDHILNGKWRNASGLASDDGENFDARGIKYMAFRKQVNGGYIYGWCKIECSARGDTLKLYGYGYNDVPSDTPNIRIGEEECFTGISETELPATVRLFPDKMIVSYPQPVHLSFYNVHGQVVEEGQLQGGTETYSYPTLPKGLYVVQLSSGVLRKTLKIVQQ